MSHLDEKMNRLAARLALGFVFSIVIGAMLAGAFYLWVLFFRLMLRFV